MSPAAALFTPLIVLLPVAGVVESAADPRDHRPPAVATEPPAALHGPAEPAYDPWAGKAFREIAESFRSQSQGQVRIEQHMTIRIAPRPGPMPSQPNFTIEVPRSRMVPRIAQREIGRCLPVSGIAGVQPDAGGRIILFMRDRRMVSAELERSCRARDFYSGFYVQRTSDGQVCVDRDTLQSRSGSNCKLSRIRQLILLDD